MGQQVDLGDYVEVPERIAEFYAAHPNGSLQSEWELLTVGEQLHVVVTAYAYRDPYDVRPGIGTAWEPIPGRTSFTRGSELMNGETSAWGRAIAALGFRSKRSVASAEEVRVAKDRAENAIDKARADEIIASLRAHGMKLKEVALLLGSLGIDGLRANSPKALTERIESLSDDEAEKLEAHLRGES